MIYGGTKYNDEVKGSTYRRILLELGRKGKLRPMPDKRVDGVAAQLKIIAPEKAFDDEHLVALVVVSKCCVICTDDKRSDVYLKRPDFYPKGLKPPKIYRRQNHDSLCCKDHIVAVCR